MIDLDKAAQATRAYFRSGHVVLTAEGNTVCKHKSGHEAQAACDRLNLAAVLEAIIDPSVVASAVYEANVARNMDPSGIFIVVVNTLIDKTKGAGR